MNIWTQLTTAAMCVATFRNSADYRPFIKASACTWSDTITCMRIPTNGINVWRCFEEVRPCSMIVLIWKRKRRRPLRLGWSIASPLCQSTIIVVWYMGRFCIMRAHERLDYNLTVYRSTVAISHSLWTGGCWSCQIKSGRLQIRKNNTSLPVRGYITERGCINNWYRIIAITDWSWWLLMSAPHRSIHVCE